MAYCVAADVQAEIQTTPFSATTRPTLTQVTGFCSEVSSDMDAVFQGIGATLPLDTSDLEVAAFVKLTAVYGVCARAFRTMGNFLEKSKDYQTLFDDRMKKVERLPKTISPLSGVKGASGPSSTIAEVDTTDRAFQRDTEQW